MFGEIGGGELGDSGDINGGFSAIRWLETDATRGRWPRPNMELGVAGSLVFDALALTESLLSFEVTRMDGVGLGWRFRRLESTEELCTCGNRGDDGEVRDTPVTVGFGGWRVTLALRRRVTSSGEEALTLLVTFGSITDRSERVTVELEEIDLCIPTACGFTEGGREMEIDEAVEPGTVLFSAR